MREAKQVDNMHQTHSLGSHLTWIVPGKKAHITGGQTCPNGMQRQVKVHFECSPDEALLRVAEPERCSYEMYVSTPAACA
eukprot:m.36585 g.36585  ORF g.36585 m.36585 type:complete len:80 (+) comp5401_c0_seq1:337-576(+)